MLVNKIAPLVVCVAAATIGACAGSSSSGGQVAQVGSCRKWTIQYANPAQFPPKETGETCTTFSPAGPCLVWTTHYHAYLTDPALAYERVCAK